MAQKCEEESDCSSLRSLFVHVDLREDRVEDCVSERSGGVSEAERELLSTAVIKVSSQWHLSTSSLGCSLFLSASLRL